MPERNTLKQVKYEDAYWLRQVTLSGIRWYFKHCEDITGISEYLGQDDAVTFEDILNCGLQEMQSRVGMMKQGDHDD